MMRGNGMRGSESMGYLCKSNPIGNHTSALCLWFSGPERTGYLVEDEGGLSGCAHFRSSHHAR